jgi:pimeloyl-ACP methyl ester carboxylesterase
VASHLVESGHRAITVDLPCDVATAGLDAYAEAAIAALPSGPSDLIVVGHSLGALTASLVASRTETRRLAFVAGIIGAPGKSLADLATVDGDRDGELGKGDLEFNEAGLFRFSRAGAMRTLFHDCDPGLAEIATGRLRFQHSLWNEVADFEDWRADELLSIVCRDDRIVHPAWSQRVSTERLGVEATHIDGGHSPWLSRPAELAQLLVD